MTTVAKNIGIFVAGIVTTLAVFGVLVYNKSTAIPKMFTGITSIESCPIDTTTQAFIESANEEEEIYFVGCGGFF